MNIFKKFSKINDQFRTSSKHQYPYNPSKEFKINEKSSSPDHPFFNFDTTPFTKSKEVEVPFIKQNIKDPRTESMKKVAPIPLQNYKVDTMKAIAIENPFKMMTNNKEIEPLKHVNPQYYQYKLYKNSLQDIALAHMDAEAGEETEYTKAFGEFMNAYEKEDPVDAKAVVQDVKKSIAETGFIVSKEIEDGIIPNLQNTLNAGEKKVCFK